MVRRGRGRIELILLNVTLRAIAPGSPPPTPFVPAGNKRRFHPRDVVKLLSLPRVFPTPSPSLPSFISRIPRLYTGFAKMIYGRLGSLHHRPPSPPPPRVGASMCTHVPCAYTYTRTYEYTMEDGDLNGLQRWRRA